MEKMQPSLMIFLVLRKTFHCLNVPVTNERLRNLITEQSYQGSLRTIKEVLSDLNIESKVYQLEEEDLNLVECPVIVHFKDDLYNKFVVVVDIQENQMKYYDPITDNYIIERESLFFKKWTNTVLIPFTDEQSGDHDYSTYFKENRQKKVINIGIFAGISMSVIILLIQNILNYSQSWMIWTLIFSVKIIALAVVSQIVTIELGESNNFIGKICKTTDCGKVLRSKASKPFSWLTMGDAGMIYFSSGVLLLIIAPFLDIISIVYLLFFLNIFTLPYTLFSISYQYFILKSWCPFCLSVMVLLWIEFFLGLTVRWTVVFPLSINLILLFCFSGIIITVGWLVLKKLLIATNTAKSLKTHVNTIKKDTALFKAILSNQNSIPEFTSSSEIVLGNDNAKNVFIAIISMSCHHCADFYRSIQRFLMFHSNELKVILRFKPNGWDNEIIEYLLTFNMKNMKGKALLILEDWYNREDRDINMWKRKFDLDGMMISDDAKQMRKDYHNWFLSADIPGTPAMILNNKSVPVYYTFNDLKYLLKKM